MKSESDKRVVTYSYERHPDYRIVYANGAVGGATPRGEVMYDLFIEFVGVPEETTHSITPDGLGPEIGRKPETPPFTRQSQIGVVMTPGQAKSFGYWLINQVENMERKKGAAAGQGRGAGQGGGNGGGQGAGPGEPPPVH